MDHTEYTIFISHKSADNQHALTLQKMLLEIDPSLEGKIFLDISPERPMDRETDWYDALMRKVAHSRHLIFLTSNLDYLREGRGWIYEEVTHFKTLMVNRDEHGRGNRNISYFGIFLCPCDFENSLFNDTSGKGEKYRSLYHMPQQLVLDNGERLEDCADILKIKVQNMLCGRSDDVFARLMAEKTAAFARRNIENGNLLAPEAIDDDLLPLARRGEDKLDFAKICALLPTKHVQLLGSAGGCGKTTLLTKLYHHHLQQCTNLQPDSMIPLYVEAKNLFGVRDLLLRYLAQHLFGEHTAQTDLTTSKNVGDMAAEFSQDRESPRYLLLIDGCNELPDNSVETFSKELQHFLSGGRYRNVRVVVSGRHISCNLPENDFTQLTMEGLKRTAVESYLRKRGRVYGIQESLFRVLSLPMYLKMYADTFAEGVAQTKADLLCAFLQWQQEKDKVSAVDEKQAALNELLLRHALPAVAHGVITQNLRGSTFVLTQQSLFAILSEVKNRMCEYPYVMHYGYEYMGLLTKADLMHSIDWQFAFAGIEYFTRTSKILRRDNNDTFEFVHQIYRDFFCALYVAEELKRAQKAGQVCTSLSAKLLDDDITEFAAQLLKEEHPALNTDSGLWDYSCNQRSCLVAMLDILRRSPEASNAVCVANILQMLKAARWNNLSGLDLSGLDLTGTDLRTCFFSRYDPSGRYATSFAGARLNRENIFTESHFTEFLAACTNEQYIACVDSVGILKLWEKVPSPQFPVKIITGLRYAIRRLLFAPDGQSLYAMTAHEILQVPIPEAFMAEVQPQVLFKTTKRLRNMRLDGDGQPQFTTNMNSFNFKSIHDPDAPDTTAFYGINSAAAVNAAGDRLAFGYITGVECLKLYDILPEGIWQERRFGYSAILHEFFMELENLFRKCKLYYRFPSDNENPGQRRTYFSYMQQQFMDRTHDHQLVPGIIVSRCRKYLENNKTQPIRLFASQNALLNALVAKYEQRMNELYASNTLLMLLSGRKVASLGFKKDTNTLLICGTIDYKEKLRQPSLDPKKRYDSLVVEMDVNTFKTSLVARYIGEYPLRAFYSGDDVMVISKFRVVVYDGHGARTGYLAATPILIRNFVSSEDTGTFYAISPDFIYEMDQNMRCVNSFRNDLNSTRLRYGTDEKGQPLLCRKWKQDPEGMKVVDLSVGQLRETTDAISNLLPNSHYATVGPMQFKTCSASLVAFRDDLKTDTMTIPYQLFVCGCDFRGVEGTAADPQYLQLLYRMGAVTDPVELPRETLHISSESFTPSDADFVLPGDLRACPYAYRSGMQLRDNCFFSDAVGGNELYSQKTWALISKGSASKNALEAADYSILEWVNRLGYALPDMIIDLVEAGLIEKPRQYSDVAKRISGPLHKTFNFIFRSQFCVGESWIPTSVLTVEFPHGSRLLQHITDKAPDNLLRDLQGKKNPSRWSESGKHRKVCIDHPLGVREVRRSLALNRWFTRTARQFSHLLEDYSLNTVFDTDNHFNGRANVHGFIRLGRQPFFAQAARRCEVEDPVEEGSLEAPTIRRIEFEEDLPDKVERLCILAVHYRALVRYGRQMGGLERQPVIVLIGEDLEQCCLLDEQLRHIHPHVRKLYTFDSLLSSEEAFAGAGNYIEFVNGQPHSLRLDTLLDK